MSWLSLCKARLVGLKDSLTTCGLSHTFIFVNEEMKLSAVEPQSTIVNAIAAFLSLVEQTEHSSRYSNHCNNIKG